jgi:ElaB/YqjD/DUF883 family membrane-anchored ribosome-binding protein
MENRLTAKTAEALNQDVDRLKRDAARVVQDVREHANAHVEETRQRVTATFDSVREKLAANPLYLLGFGFALGLLLGLRLASNATTE